MRALACLLVVAASATAAAHPSQQLNGPGPGRSMPPHARRPPPPGDDLFDLRVSEPPPEPCATGKTWKHVEACLKKQGAVKVIYDVPLMKVVQIPFGGTTTSSRLWLFVQTDKGSWNRAAFTGYTDVHTEILGIAPFTAEVGTGLRVDLGSSTRTSFAVEPNVVERGILRRVNTTVCVPTGWACRTITTACDAYVHGHLLWSYQSEIVWKSAIGLRLHVDTSRAGGMCTPLKSMVDEAE